MSNQSGVQASIRAITSTALDYNSDWSALFDADSIASGDWNGRLLAWINATMSASYASLPAAQQAFASARGFNNWSSMNATRLSARHIIESLGLDTGLELCLDAGDAGSYTSGQSWLDLSGNGYDFFRGADGNASTDDPTFNGTAGHLSSSEYWSFDGGDVFTYDTTNETWMANLHKDNAIGTFMVGLYIPSGAVSATICGDRGVATAHTGCLWFLDGANPPKLSWQVRNAGSVVASQTSALTLSGAAWNIVGISIDESVGAGGIIHFVNGSTDTDTSTYTSPDAGAASYTFQIGAAGNTVTPLPSTARMAFFAGWSRALSAVEMQSFYTAARVRLGI